MNDPKAATDVLTRLELYFSVRQMNRALRQYHDVLNNDYDMVAIFLLVAEVGFRSIIHLAAENADYARMEQIYMDEGSLGISMMNIGEASGIPRETVRRKIKWLTDEGYLAVIAGSKNIYLPLSTVTNDRLVDIFSSHTREVVQLVRTIQLYCKPSA